MNDLLAPLRAATTDADAAEIAQSLVDDGRADDLGAALDRALGDDARPLAATERARLVAALGVVADEVSAAERAAALWSHLARARRASDPRSAFDAAARAFAYDPSRDGTLALVRELARGRDVALAADASRWLRGLVRRGVLAHADVARFDAALEPAEPPTEDDALWREMTAVGSYADAEALVARLAREGRLDRAAALVVDRWRRVEPYAPEGTRLLYAVVALHDRMPPSPARGEVAYARAELGASQSDPATTLVAAARVFADRPEHPGADALVRRVFDDYAGELERGDLRRAAAASGLPDTFEAYLYGLWRANQRREE